jgi:hypothetical protein
MMNLFMSENYDYKKIELSFKKHHLFQEFDIHLENNHFSNWLWQKLYLFLFFLIFLYLFKVRILLIPKNIILKIN